MPYKQSRFADFFAFSLILSELLFQAKEIPGIKIFRFDGAVYFANAERFKTNLFKYTGLDPKVLKAKKAKMDAEAEVVVPAEAEVSLKFEFFSEISVISVGLAKASVTIQ